MEKNSPKGRNILNNNNLDTQAHTQAHTQVHTQTFKINLEDFTLKLKQFQARVEFEITRKPAKVVKFSNTVSLSTKEISHYIDELYDFILKYRLTRRNFIDMDRKAVYLTGEQYEKYGDILRVIGKKPLIGQVLYAFALFQSTYMKNEPHKADAVNRAAREARWKERLDEQDGLLEAVEGINTSIGTTAECVMDFSSMEGPLGLGDMDIIDSEDALEMQCPDFELDGVRITLNDETEVDMSALFHIEGHAGDRWNRYFKEKQPFFTSAVPQVQVLIDTVCTDVCLVCPKCGARHVFLVMMRDNEYGVLYGCVKCGTICFDNSNPVSAERLVVISHFNLWIKLVMQGGEL